MASYIPKVEKVYELQRTACDKVPGLDLFWGGLELPNLRGGVISHMWPGFFSSGLEFRHPL